MSKIENIESFGANNTFACVWFVYFGTGFGYNSGFDNRGNKEVGI